MSFLGKLGFINEVPEEEKNSTEAAPSVEKPEVKQSSAPEIRKPAISFAQPIKNITPGQIVGKFDNDIFEKLSIAIEDNNLDGNDFFEFLQSLNKMSGLSVDDNTKFNMVFATLATSSGGMTKPHLIDSIAHYLSVTDNERKIFQKEMAKATAEMVDGKNAYAEQLTQSAKDKADQIQKLSEEIQKINEEIANTKAESIQSALAISQKQADFDVTVQQLENQITDYKTKIEQYIK